MNKYTGPLVTPVNMSDADQAHIQWKWQWKVAFKLLPLRGCQWADVQHMTMKITIFDTTMDMDTGERAITQICTLGELQHNDLPKGTTPFVFTTFPFEYDSEMAHYAVYASYELFSGIKGESGLQHFSVNPR